MLETADINRRFYNMVAHGYDRADGRRNKNHDWLETRIKNLAKATRGEALLDIGAGTGLVSVIAAKYFKVVVAYDTAENMLLLIPRRDNLLPKTGYAEKVTYPDNTFDAVTAFATLHHIEDYVQVFKEAYRVLKPGGILYTDHDIERQFVKKHQTALKIYRGIRNARGRFARISKEAGQLYDETEVWGDGIDADHVRIALSALRFRPIIIEYHWDGVLPGLSLDLRGHAPIMRVMAVKPGGVDG